MPVETAIYIHDLNPADPVSTDGIKQGDDHIRLNKTVLQNTFPNATAAITGTPDQLNRAAAGRANAGTLEVEANGTSAGGQLKLDPIAGSGAVTLQNTGTASNDGSLAISINDRTNANPITAATLSKAGAFKAAASVDAPVILQNGAVLVPRGVIWMWSGAANAVPAGFNLCDGTNGTPDARNCFIVAAGGTYAVGQTGGAASAATVTDNQGLHFHTGATALGGPYPMSATTDVQGSHSHTGFAGSTALTIAQMPYHDHGIAAGTGVVVIGGTSNLGFGAGSQGGTDSWNGVSGGGGGQGHTHGIAADGAHAHNVSVSNVPAHVHGISADGAHAHNVTVNTLPPYYAFCLIMKL